MSDLDQLQASANTTQETINQAAEQVRAAYATACDLHHQLATLGLDPVENNSATFTLGLRAPRCWGVRRWSGRMAE